MADEAPAGRTKTHFGRPAAPTGDGGPPPHRELRPWLWALAYVLVTTLAFSPTPSFRDSPVTPGMVAPSDVVAPRDLIVPDPDATARRRAEASAEVLPAVRVRRHGARSASRRSCAPPSPGRGRSPRGPACAEP